MKGRPIVLVLASVVALGATLIASSMGAPSPTLPSPPTPRSAALNDARAHARALARTLKPQRSERATEPRARVAEASHAAALFATHSWYVAPPPPPPVAPPPPPPPQAPPFPYTFVGSYTPSGDAPVYFLAKADRVIDAHVGDRLDGIYAFESAGSGSLVFNYLPLNVRQSVAIGVPQ